MQKTNSLEQQVSDIILEIANSYNDVTTSDLQGMADAAAAKIVRLVATR
jgi:hypothetical protein